MTTVIGIKTPNGVLIGADSQITAWNQRQEQQSKFAKIVELKSDRHPHILFGVCGNAAINLILSYRLKLHEPYRNQGALAYACTHVFDAITAACGEAQLSRTEVFSGDILMAVDNELLLMSESGFVAMQRDICAVGSGAQFAIGAMEAAKIMRPTISPFELAETGLTVATKHDVYTARPFIFKTQGVVSRE
jgi:ATP-dependent protease HslVU (ClpYQ) peptidase subunit